MLAERGLPTGSLDRWAVEPKLDGWRVTVLAADGRVVVRTRRGHTITEMIAGLDYGYREGGPSPYPLPMPPGIPSAGFRAGEPDPMPTDQSGSSGICDRETTRSWSCRPGNRGRTRRQDRPWMTLSPAFVTAAVTQVPSRE
jgi:hypothetical protein